MIDIQNIITELKEKGLGVLISDHNVRETLDIIDRAYIMHDGQVLMEGVPSERRSGMVNVNGLLVTYGPQDLKIDFPLAPVPPI